MPLAVQGSETLVPTSPVISCFCSMENLGESGKRKDHQEIMTIDGNRCEREAYMQQMF